MEHIYLEDKTHAVLQLASQANITISYETTKARKRSRRPPKPPEKRSSLMTGLNSKRAIDTRLSVEFFDDDTESTTILGTKGLSLRISHGRVTLLTLMDVALKRMR